MPGHSTVGSQRALLRRLGSQPKIARIIEALSQFFGSVTTFAGSTRGFAEGTGTAAQFNFPVSFVADSGNLYVADASNHRIRKIDPTGVVTTFAGSGVDGATDGTGTAAQFSSPRGLVVDNGNLYVADAGNNRIRKIVISTGVVTTLAGSAGGYLDGTGTAARFNVIRGMVADSGNLYVTDAAPSSNRIRKIVIATGVVTTFAGSTSGYLDGTGTAAQFNFVDGITANNGNLYVSDRSNNKIRKIVIATGVVTTLAGSAPGSGDATGTNAQFNEPAGIVATSNNLYVCDANNHRIRKIEIATGVVTTITGSNTGYLDGGLNVALFSRPEGITASNGNLYVSDSNNNHTIRKIEISPIVTTFAGSTSGFADGTGTAAQFFSPSEFASDSGNLYIADMRNNRIRKISPTGVVTTFAGSGSPGYLDGTGTAAQFNNPLGITADSGNLYVSDTFNNRIRKIVIATGVVTTLAGSGVGGTLDGTGTAAQFGVPRGILANNGNLYIADAGNNRIRKIVISSGVVTTFAGSMQGSLDGTGTAARFYGPQGITADNGNLYVSDTINNTIRKIVISTGVVTTLAGSVEGFVDGTGTAAQFNYPNGIAVDNGSLYVSDSSNDTIRKIVISTRVVTTIAGSTLEGFADGTGTAARFRTPQGMIMNSGNLYVADSTNNRIRQITLI